MSKAFFILNLTAVGLTILTGCGGSEPTPPKVQSASFKPKTVEIQPESPAKKEPYYGGLAASRQESGPLNWPSFANWGVSETAADSLARIGTAAVPALVTALQDGDPKVRLQAARALARIGPDAKLAVPALTRSLSDPDLNVRMNSARALGQIGPAAQDAIPALIRSLRN